MSVPGLLISQLPAAGALTGIELFPALQGLNNPVGVLGTQLGVTALTTAEADAGLIASDIVAIYRPGFAERFKIKADGATNDTVNVNKWIAAAQEATTLHAPGATMYGIPGSTCVISQITFNVGGLRFEGNGMAFLGNASGATTYSSLIDIIDGENSLFQDIQISGAFNWRYSCGLHWYTYNLNNFYPGYLRANNVLISGFLIGMSVGALPAQILPVPAQNYVDAAPNATDAPLSESYISGLITEDCVIGVAMAQPNGKITLDAPVIRGDNSGWAGNYGSSGFDATYTRALKMVMGTSQSSEVTVLGGSLEQNVEATGKFLELVNCNVLIKGTTMESTAASFIDLNSHVTIDTTQNGGYNFPGNYPPWTVGKYASGSLNFLSSPNNYPAGAQTGGTGSPFVLGVTGLGGGFAQNVSGFTVNFTDCENSDIPLNPLGGNTGYTPTVLGVAWRYTNTKFVSRIFAAGWNASAAAGVMTVAAHAGATGIFGIGSVVNGTGIPLSGGATPVVITSFGTGTGGAGTYNVSVGGVGGTAAWSLTADQSVGTANTSIVNQYTLNDGENLLRGIVDRSNYSLTGYAANGNSGGLVGGWTFTVTNVGTCEWGKTAPAVAIPVLGRTLNQCNRMLAPAGETTTATSQEFGVDPQVPRMLRMFLGASNIGGSANITIQANWYKFGGAASATVSTTLLNATDSVIHAWPGSNADYETEFLLMPPPDTCLGQIVVSCADGATIEFLDIHTS